MFYFIKIRVGKSVFNLKIFVWLNVKINKQKGLNYAYDRPDFFRNINMLVRR